MSRASTGAALEENVAAAAPSAAALTITGFGPAVVRVGTRFVVELHVANSGPGSRAVNVYVRCAGTPIGRLHCRGGRTSTGRVHGSAVVCLGPGAEAKVVGLVGPGGPGGVVVRADAGGDDASGGTVVSAPAVGVTGQGP